MREVLIVIVGAVIGELVRVYWSRINYHRSAPPELGFDGNITPGKISAAIVTFTGVAIALFGIAAIFNGALGIGLICLVSGVAVMIFMAPSLTHMHDVSWNATEVHGPCRRFGPSLGRSRTAIRWNEITSTGKTRTGYWFIQSRDGRRIYWSYLYPGYGRFADSLKLKRPMIALPADLH